MLFAQSEVFGTFKGFNEKGLEFAAEIVAPYDASMLERPQLGQFLLIELGSTDEASLGRITRFAPTGLLTGPEGEDYINNMQRRQQLVPEDLKKDRLKYKVQIKLLGAVRVNGNDILYIPSQRRLPHLGAKVALPSAAVLTSLCKLSGGTTELGDYVLGEFVYSGSKEKLSDPVFRLMDPKLPVMFDIKNLISRRSVVFARAGYGKSNLIKFLVSELYRNPPKTEGGLEVGTLIFDADGEYFWPDVVRNRPGLCDVPHVQDKIMVYTNRKPVNAYYRSWKAGEVKLDIRDLPARDVIGIAVSSERQSQQNVLKLKGLSQRNWRDLVDIVFTKGYQATDQEIGSLIGYQGTQITQNTAEIAAARSNMNQVVHLLHDPNSTVLNGTIEGLKKGSIVVVDISLLSATAGNMLAGLLLRRIFSHNQENFTGGGSIIPAIVIIEEAQSVLGRNLDETSPFVEWVKEGRKYELGAILITQQPGSMAPELMSQADNWFCFHLLSEGDANTLGKYNSHFSNDVLSHLIAEPIRGNCFMWSAPHQPFVLPVRIRSFEELFKELVRSNTDAIAIKGTRVDQIREAVDQQSAQISDAFVKQLATKAKVYRLIEGILPNGGTGLGVYSGQLYHLIKAIKSPTDIRSEEDLKRILFSATFGEEAVYFVKDRESNREFYCTYEEIWCNILECNPEVHDTISQVTIIK